MALAIQTSGIYHRGEGGFRGEKTYLLCSQYIDNVLGQPLESIRDRGTCLDAIKAIDATYDLTRLTSTSPDTGDAPCSGCFLEEEVPHTGIVHGRFCDYDPSIGVDGPLQDDRKWISVCVSSVSPSPPPPSPPPPSPPSQARLP